MNKKEQIINKINVYIKVNDYKINTEGFLNQNKITCIDPNDNTNFIYDKETKVLTRENNTQKIEIDFQNKKVKYTLKDYKKELTQDILIEKYIENENQIEITYLIEETKFELNISYNID